MCLFCVATGRIHDQPPIHNYRFSITITPWTTDFDPTTQTVFEAKSQTILFDLQHIYAMTRYFKTRLGFIPAIWILETKGNVEIYTRHELSPNEVRDRKTNRVLDYETLERIFNDYQQITGKKRSKSMLLLQAQNPDR